MTHPTAREIAEMAYREACRCVEDDAAISVLAAHISTVLARVDELERQSDARIRAAIEAAIDAALEEAAQIAHEAAIVDAGLPTDRITRASRAGSIEFAIRRLKPKGHPDAK